MTDRDGATAPPTDAGVPAGLYRGYDLRGRQADGLTEASAHRIGLAIGRYVLGQDSRIVYLGRDNRASSAGLAAAVRDGLTASGCDVHDLGMVPTPMVYAASTDHEGSHGVAVTASHLPADWNGVKVCRGSRPVHTDDYRAFVDTPDGPAESPGQAIDASPIVGLLAARLAAEFPRHPMRIAIDSQNGAASIVGPEILGRIATDVVKVHCDPTAPYPFRTPDPQVAANLAILGETVRGSHAALGVAFDGDADRLGVVDETGRFVPADFVTALLAREAVRAKPGSTVVVDVLTSDVVRAVVEADGGTVVDWKSGHAFIQERMRELGAVFAGEGSGHLFFPKGDTGEAYDDGIYAACRLVDLVARDGRPLSGLVEELPRFHMTEEARPHCDDGVKRQIVAMADGLLRAQGLSVDDADGAKVRFANGWGIIRAANTEPCLSLRFEASDPDELLRYQEIVWTAVRAAASHHGVTLA